MPCNRRTFLKSLAGAGASGLLPTAGLAMAARAADPEAVGVLVDTTYCVGCRKCEWACQDANLAPEGEIASYVNAVEMPPDRRPDAGAFTVVNAYFPDDDRARADFVKVQCMHCIDPACVSACIVGALRKDERGPVSYDASKCIGCRYCMVACPFQIPAYEYFDPVTPRVMKCTLCYERTMAEGRRPACVDLCPEGCLVYGRREDLLRYAKRRIADMPDRYHDHVYGEHEAGGTSWLYLAERPLEELGLPALAGIAPGHYTERVQHAVFKNWVPPLALYGFLGMMMFLNRGQEAKHE